MRDKNHSFTPLASTLAGRLLAIGAVILLASCAQLSLPPVAGTPSPAEIEAQPETDTETAATAPQALPEDLPEEIAEPEPDKLYEWSGSGRDISHVVIDTNEQRARFYAGQEQVGWTTIASGVSAHPTPSGEFEVIEKVAKKRSNLYGRIYNAKGGLHKRNAHSSDPIPAGGKFVGASMPHFMRMTYDGIGMHAGAIPRPGQPASHGCIRLPDEIASSLFAQADIGTRVTVIGQGPDYGNYAERIRRQREQEKRNRVAAAEAKARNNTSERSSTAAGASEADNDNQGQAASDPANGSTPDSNDDGEARDGETGNGENRETNATASSSEAQPQPTERADRSRAQTDRPEGGDASAAAQRAAEPAARPQQTAPPRPPKQDTPSIRSADQDDSATAEDEQS